MWPFRRRIEDTSNRADVAAMALLKRAEEAGPQLLSVLIPHEHPKTQPSLDAPLSAKLLVLALHLTDRIAFARLGSKGRTEFMDALLLAMQRHLRPPQGSHLRQSYNDKAKAYATFRKLYPDEGENLAGTLLWEFGKELASTYAGHNPESVFQATLFSMKFLRSIEQVHDVTKTFG